MQQTPKKMRNIYITTMMLVALVTHVKGCGQQVDIALILDSSTSIGQNLFDKIKEKFKGFVHTFDVGKEAVHFAVVHFNTKATLDFGFNDHYDKVSVEKAIENIKFERGGSRLDLALSLAANKLFGKAGSARQDKPKYLIIVSDGILPQEILPFKATMDALKGENEHLHIIVVGVGPHVDPGIERLVNKEELKIFVEHEDNMIPFSEFDQLPAHIQQLSSNECMGVYQTP